MEDGSANEGESTRGICMEHLLRNDPKLTHTTEARQARTNLPGALKKAAGILGSCLADCLYPPRCPLCERILLPGEGLACDRCRRELSFILHPRCFICGKPVSDPRQELCGDCARHPHLYERGRAAFLYEKQVRRSVDRLKFYNRREYIPFYGACLYRILCEEIYDWRPECLIPVPMHPKKKAERGFDQAALLAEELGRRSNVPVREDILYRKRYTGASKKLGRASRRKNLRGVFAVHDRAVLPGRVVLIDDIYTTGVVRQQFGICA